MTQDDVSDSDWPRIRERANGERAISPARVGQNEGVVRSGGRGAQWSLRDVELEGGLRIPGDAYAKACSSTSARLSNGCGNRMAQQVLPAGPMPQAVARSDTAAMR